MTKRSLVFLTAGTLGFVALMVCAESAVAVPKAAAADAALDRALRELVEMTGGPPGAIALVQRGSSLRVHAFGVAAVGERRRLRKSDYMRIASVAKAFSEAVALSLVDAGKLSHDDTIGQRLPSQPVAWHSVTLRQLLAHTSGLPDLTESEEFQKAVVNSLTVAPPPRRCWRSLPTSRSSSRRAHSTSTPTPTTLPSA